MNKSKTKKSASFYFKLFVASFILSLDGNFSATESKIAYVFGPSKQIDSEDLELKGSQQTRQLASIVEK